jgi:hypothetical protein
MKRAILILLTLIALSTWSVLPACPGWRSCLEETVAGVPVPFVSGDTISTSVWSNECIHVTGHPVFYDYVITGASESECSLDSAILLGPDLIFNYGMGNCSPGIAERLRQGAAAQGNFYQFPEETVRAVFRGSTVQFYRWLMGTPFDSTMTWNTVIGIGTCIFVDGPLEIKGNVTGNVTIGSSGTLRILDNIKYSDSDPITGFYYEVWNRTNQLGIVSESDVVIANTPENGRENSAGLGLSQNNQSLTSIIINGVIEVLNGSFTFEDQNDSGNAYVCNCIPDERGKIYLFGSVSQYRHGYLSRTNNQFTGYQLRLRYDERLLFIRPPCSSEIAPYEFSHDTLDFGAVNVGTVAMDTIELWSMCYRFDEITVAPPFYAAIGVPTTPFDHDIQVRFLPPDTQAYYDTLFVNTNYGHIGVYLFGHGVSPSVSDSSFIPHPSSFILSCAPNPFNARTEIRFTIPQAGKVTVNLFDLTGRKVITLFDQTATAGEHTVPVDGANLASGVYFVSLEAAGKIATQKILLLK